MTSQRKPAQDYSALAAEAEHAVASVKDPELKRVAFDKILDALLAHATAPDPAPGKRPAGTAPSSRTSAAGSVRKLKKHAGPKAYIEEMITEGFFKTQRTIAQVKAELGNRGHHIALTSLSGPLQQLCQERRLRRQKKNEGKKRVYVYSNW